MNILIGCPRATRVWSDLYILTVYIPWYRIMQPLYTYNIYIRGRIKYFFFLYNIYNAYEIYWTYNEYKRRVERVKRNIVVKSYSRVFVLFFHFIRQSLIYYIRRMRFVKIWSFRYTYISCSTAIIICRWNIRFILCTRRRKTIIMSMVL